MSRSILTWPTAAGLFVILTSIILSSVHGYLYCDPHNNGDCTSPSKYRRMYSYRNFAQADFYTLVILNATIVDGSGSRAFLGNVGLVNDRIATIGLINENLMGPETVSEDGTDYFLSPGFIDSHTHDDVAILKDPKHDFKTRQGVTTIITGNCGFSSYPNGVSNALVKEHLRSLLGDVPDSYFTADFYGYRATLNYNKMGLNVGSLVGHGPLRISVMGYDQREATKAEIDAMCSLLEVQLVQGAIGMSFGLVYPPSAYAAMDELVALATVVARRGKVVTGHVRSYEGGLLSSVEEFLNVLKLSGARGLLSHLQAAGKPYWEQLIPQALQRIENARNQDGIDVVVDMYPYLAGSSTIMQLFPPSSQSGGFDAFLDKLEEAEWIQWLQEMTEQGREPGWESKVNLIGYENIVIGSVVRPELKAFEGISIVEGAGLLQVLEFDFLLYVTIEDYGQTNVIMFQQHQNDNDLVFKSYFQMVGSDSIPREGGKPHPRGYGTFPRVVGRMAAVDGTLTIEQAVRKTTSLPARTFGIPWRGRISEGYFADLVLFGRDFADTASYEDPTASPRGIKAVWVNGVKVVNEGQSLESLPGVVI